MGSTKCTGDSIFIKETNQTKTKYRTYPHRGEIQYWYKVPYSSNSTSIPPATGTVLLWNLLYTVLRIRIQDPGSGAFLTPGSGMGKKSGSGSGMNNPDHISECFELIFWGYNIKFFDAYQRSRIEEFGTGIRDGKKMGFGIRDKHPGSRINIPDPQHWLYRYKINRTVPYLPVCIGGSLSLPPRYRRGRSCKSPRGPRKCWTAHVAAPSPPSPLLHAECHVAFFYTNFRALSICVASPGSRIRIKKFGSSFQRTKTAKCEQKTAKLKQKKNLN